MPYHVANIVFSVIGVLLTLLFSIPVQGLETSIDFIICLGGDGTLLYAASLFQVCVLHCKNEIQATMLCCPYYNITFFGGIVFFIQLL